MIDFHALELIDVSIERALLFSYPAIVVLHTALSRRRLPSAGVLGAVALTYVGIVLVVGAFDGGAWRHNLVGSLLVLVCATTTAAYFLMGERFIPQLGSMGFTIIAMLSATACVALFYAASHPLGAVAQLSPHAWLLMLALAVLCMFLPTLLQAEGIRLIGAVQGSLVSTVGPPAALLLGAAQMIGTASIIVGVIVISRRGSA